MGRRGGYNEKEATFEQFFEVYFAQVVSEQIISFSALSNVGQTKEHTTRVTRLLVVVTQRWQTTGAETDFDYSKEKLLTKEGSKKIKMSVF